MVNYDNRYTFFSKLPWRNKKGEREESLHRTHSEHGSSVCRPLYFVNLFSTINNKKATLKLQFVGEKDQRKYYHDSHFSTSNFKTVPTITSRLHGDQKLYNKLLCAYYVRELQ